jgi:predicted CxxxxCH...CXXCH cytochrome family protein
MNKIKLSILVGFAVLMSLIVAAILLGPGCGSSTDNGDQQGTLANADKALKQNNAPQNGKVGQIYRDKTNKRDWIFDGAQWVPHDSTVDAYYAQLDADKSTAVQRSMTGDEVFSTCTASNATGAHAKHDAFTYTNNCKICHKVGGVLCFDPAGPAVATGKPLPSFDATAKTCSSISCHGMYSGTFEYYFPGGDGEPVLNTFSYAGSGGTTPNWYTTGAGCTACHGNPPRPAGATPVWHSGQHGGGNDCQLCHPDATGSGGVGTAITDPSLHANGTVNVQARFKTTCFGCH